MIAILINTKFNKNYNSKMLYVVINVASMGTLAQNGLTIVFLRVGIIIIHFWEYLKYVGLSSNFVLKLLTCFVVFIYHIFHSKVYLFCVMLFSSNKLGLFV